MAARMGTWRRAAAARWTVRRPMSSQALPAESMLVVPTPQRAPDELGVLAGTVQLALRRHGSDQLGFFRASNAGGFDTVQVMRSRFRNIACRDGLIGLELERALGETPERVVTMVASAYDKFRAETRVEFAVVEGFWAPGHSSSYLHRVNAMLATRLGSSVLATVDARNQSAVAVGSASQDLVHELERAFATVAGVVVVQGARGEMPRYLEKLDVPVAGVIPRDHLVSTPSFLDLVQQLDAEVLCGAENRLQQLINPSRIEVATELYLEAPSDGPSTLPRDDLIVELRRQGGLATLDSLRDAVRGVDRDALAELDLDGDGLIREEDVCDYSAMSLVICSLDRVDVVTAVLLDGIASGFSRFFSGVLVCGEVGSFSRVKQTVDVALAAHRAATAAAPAAADLLPPVLYVKSDILKTIEALQKVTPQIGLRTQRRIDRAVGNFSNFVDGQFVLKAMQEPPVKMMTPFMFEHQFMHSAAQKDKHIVLPEGTEPRILQATSELLRNRTARITLLGAPDDVRAVARKHDVDIQGADIIDPATDSETIDKYVKEFVRLRSKKGANEEIARDAMHDVNYLGTMMVHCDDADGMVSGSVHTTAATVRPALQLIKTKPGISIVSSVFFMCLPSQVLVYGDCAINPSPTAAELAQIAVTSAKTAAQFGIEPRVALLSFFSGDRDSNPEVRKVTEALQIAKELDPELDIHGPIQYDAAVDEGIARGKGVGIGGPANVLIFPDLNTGNVGYKAVQQSSGALAVGPVLQGLNKPINDLSRGATVPDIVNTVAITACLVE